MTFCPDPTKKVRIRICNTGKRYRTRYWMTYRYGTPGWLPVARQYFQNSLYFLASQGTGTGGPLVAHSLPPSTLEATICWYVGRSTTSQLLAASRRGNEWAHQYLARLEILKILRVLVGQRWPTYNFQVFGFLLALQNV